MSILGNLVIKIVGDNSEFNKTITQTQRQLNNSTKSLQTIARNMTTVGDSMNKFITVPILAAGAGLLKLGSDFDSAYDKIRVGTGKTGSALGKLQNDFKAVAKVAPSSFNDISTVIAELNTRLGLTGKPLQNLSTQMLNLARITKSDINSLIPATTRVFGDWSISTDKQSKALDYMYRVSQSTGISIDQLSEKVVFFGAPLRQMGFDFETSTALIGKWEKEGVNAELVLGSLRIALGKFATVGVKDTNAALLELIDQIKNAGSTGEATSIAIEAFGRKAGPDMAAAIREGRFDLEGLIENLKNSTETINGAAKATDDWKEKLVLLKNNLGIALEPLATKVFDLLSRSVEGVTPKIEDLAEKFGNLSPTLQDNLIKYGLIAAALPLVVSGLGRAVTGAVQLRNALLLLNAAVKSNVLFSAAGLTSGALASAVLVIGGAANRLGNLTKAFALNEIAAMSWNDRILEVINVVLLGIPEILNAITRVIGLPAKEFTMGYGAMIKAIFEGKPVIENTTMSMEDQTKAFNDALGGMTAYETAQHQGKELTVEARVAAVDYENALQGLMLQYGFTREQAEEYYNKTQEGTEDIDDQKESVDELRGAFASLTKTLFDGITTSNDFQEAGWALEDAQKAVTEAIKKHGEDSREVEQAINDLDKKSKDYIDTAYGVYTSILTTKEEQDTAKQKALEYGLQLVNSGKLGEDAFISMAEQFGLSAQDISKFTDGLINPAIDTTQEKLDALGQTVATPKVTVDVSAANSALNNLQAKLDSMNFKVYQAKMAALDKGYLKGGIVGYKKGGIADKFLSASDGIIIPKFDNGGVLAMLHPPEIVLNTKEAMQLVWNMANQQVKKTDLNNDYNLNDKPIEIRNVIELEGRVLYDKVAEGLADKVQIKSRGAGR